jgi:hypothetical protein
MPSGSCRSASVRGPSWPLKICSSGSSWALYQERRVASRRADDATRIALVVVARLIDWRRALTIVQPDTLILWHRKGFRLFCGGSPGRLAGQQYRRISSG